MWNPRFERENKTPVNNEEREGRSALPSEALSKIPSPSATSMQQASQTEGFTTPNDGIGLNYVIIPLHSPTPKKPVIRPLLFEKGELKSNSPAITSLRSLDPVGETSCYTHRRSPEKRLLSPGPICRICHEDGQSEQLLSPCNCSGSLKLVHKSCLEKWLSASNSDKCEICKIRLPVHREARPLWQWFRTTNSIHGPQGFYADMTCLLLLSPLCLVSVYLCAVGAIDYMQHGIWEGTGLGILSCFLLSTYLLWFYVTVRFHWKTVRRWRSSNQVIHLVEKKCRRLNHTPQNSYSNPVNTSIPASRLVFSPQVQGASPQIINQQNISAGTMYISDSSLEGVDYSVFL